MDRGDHEADTGGVDAAHSADYLVAEDYPPHLRPHQVEHLKTLFMNIPDKGPEHLASQLLKSLKLPSYPLSEEEVQEFLLYVSQHGHTEESKTRARLTYSVFTDLDLPPRSSTSQAPTSSSHFRLQVDGEGAGIFWSHF
ncbi:hypothetical protein HDV00_005510 [Rhizophlyctis rosea]|nr:hypothetical protein HDV00_005510 [Rhizophlyctis rosea]